MTEKIAKNEINGAFTAGEVLNNFNAKFLDKDFCRQWVLDKLHPEENKTCPECGEQISANQLQSFWDGKRIKCWNCGKWFTALTGTFLSGSHLTFQEVLLMVFMIGIGIEDKYITKKLCICPESVRLWRLKFKELEKVKS